MEKPLLQLKAADADRILEILVGTAAVAVDGHAKRTTFPLQTDVSLLGQHTDMQANDKKSVVWETGEVVASELVYFDSN